MKIAKLILGSIGFCLLCILGGCWTTPTRKTAIPLRVEPLEDHRYRIATFGCLEGVLSEFGIGREEPYWGAMSIYAEKGSFPRMTGAVANEVGRTVANVTVEFEFVGQDPGPKSAKVTFTIRPNFIGALASDKGKFGKTVRSAVEIAGKKKGAVNGLTAKFVSGKTLEFKRVVAISEPEKLISQFTYGRYFGNICYGINAPETDLDFKSTDVGDLDVRTEPVFRAKGEKEMQLDLRWRLIMRNNRLIVVTVKELGEGKVRVSAWLVPEEDVNEEEAIKSAAKRWEAVNVSLVDEDSYDTWHLDSKTGCMIVDENRSAFYPIL